MEEKIKTRESEWIAVAMWIEKIGRKKWLWAFLAVIAIVLLHPLGAHAAAGGMGGLPTLNIQLGQSNSPGDISKSVQIIILLTVLTLAPSILIMSTAFTRIVIVLSLVRHALGNPQLPPNQIIVGLSLILTFFVMAPTFNQINEKAFKPFMASQIQEQAAIDNTFEPLRTFMFKQVNESDVALFIQMAKLSRPRTTHDVPTYVLLPAFVISELRTAFTLGFIVFLPFLVIDVVVSSILVSMGMMFLPPVTISTPFKLVLFVLVDGWHLITEALVRGFM